MADFYFQLKDLAVGYHGNPLIRDINIGIDKGEIVTLIGPNGSGKSTILKSITRQLKLIGGTVFFDDTSLMELSYKELSSKMAVVLTERIKTELMNCHDIVATGRYPYTGRLGILTKRDEELVEEAMEAVHAQELGNQDFNAISDGQRQRVLLARAICQEPEILILDEPTSSLNDEDAKMLLDLLMEFKKNGLTSIIITHKLNEIIYCADRCTIIRDGTTIETLTKGVDDLSEDRIIKGMVGRSMDDRYPTRKHNVSKEVMLEVKDWTVHHPLYPEKIVDNKINCKVHKGEVVGFSGLQGAGRTEFAMSVFGKSYGSNISGELYIKGEKVNLKNPHDAIRHGLAYVTEDRKTNGLILGESIRFNTTLARLSKVCEKGVVNTDMEVHLADEMTKEMGTKTPSNEQKIGNLSGGNQQKALLGKWMFTEPDILILDEPTRGIDVGAKYDIYCLINKMVEDGKSVIMISSEMPELLGMCDRIYVMSEGRLAGEFTAEEATQERIMASIMQEQNKK